MAKLIYGAITSLDGYIEDEDGMFDWAAPDDEVHAFMNELERSVGTFLFGRKMYETMSVWETDPSFAEQSPLLRDYAQIWQSADKIVYSRTLQTPTTTRTRIERDFEPDTVRTLLATARRDIAIAGPDLAQHAFKAGLVDECHLTIVPVTVGGGKPGLPRAVRLNLTLLDVRRFANGTVHLRYRVDR